MGDLTAKGMALLCDATGAIRDVIRNDLGLLEALPGRLFLRLADSASRAKAMDFLAAIKQRGAAFDWELNVRVGQDTVTLHFSGGLIGEQLLIVAAADGRLLAQLYKDMLHISNEQANLLRAAVKENEQAGRITPSLYDEVSRLNNELVGMQRELAKRNAELRRLNEEKNRFLGMAAHDLRNPLHIILWQSEYLLEIEEDPERREMLHHIYGSSEFMASLIDDLLDVAKIEAGQLVLDLWPTDVVALVTRNVTLNRLLAVGKQTTIDLDAQPMPQALVDAAKIEQVLNNLIGNAVKYSPPGSRIQVSLSQVDASFQLAVRDQGPGIPPEEHDALFRPFQRGTARTTAGEKSTGLGLTIVKRIVEGHGGRIWIESPGGQGTAFLVSIPFQPTASEGGTR